MISESFSQRAVQLILQRSGQASLQVQSNGALQSTAYYQTIRRRGGGPILPRDFHQRITQLDVVLPDDSVPPFRKFVRFTRDLEQLLLPQLLQISVKVTHIRLLSSFLPREQCTITEFSNAIASLPSVRCHIKGTEISIGSFLSLNPDLRISTLSSLTLSLCSVLATPGLFFRSLGRLFPALEAVSLQNVDFVGFGLGDGTAITDEITWSSCLKSFSMSANSRDHLALVTSDPKPPKDCRVMLCVLFPYSSHDEHAEYHRNGHIGAVSAILESVQETLLLPRFASNEVAVVLADEDHQRSISIYPLTGHTNSPNLQDVRVSPKLFELRFSEVEWYEVDWIAFFFVMSAESFVLDLGSYSSQEDAMAYTKNAEAVSALCSTMRVLRMDWRPSPPVRMVHAMLLDEDGASHFPALERLIIDDHSSPDDPPEGCVKFMKNYLQARLSIGAPIKSVRVVRRGEQHVGLATPEERAAFQAHLSDLCEDVDCW